MPRRRGQTRPDDRSYWVELRVHGVSGTPPEELLGTAHVRQVAGDGLGRVFKPTDSAGRDTQSEDDRLLEGYHWGQFTSGSWRMGLWLVLIPFGFVNAAAFMLPAPGKNRTTRALHSMVGGLIRAIGLGLTCTFAMMAGIICVDVLSWQAASRLSWLQWASTGMVMAVGVLAAALVVYGLSRLGNQSRRLDFPEAPPGSVAAQRGGGLARAQFYRGNPDAPILSRLHLAGGLAVVGLVGNVTAARATVERAPELGVPVAIGLLAATALMTTVLGDPEQSVTGARSHTWHERLADPASQLMVGVAWTVVAVAMGSLYPTDRQPLPLTFDEQSRWLTVSMALVVVLLLAATSALAWRTMRKGRRDFRRYARGLAPWAAATAGLSLGIGYAGAFVLGTARAVGATVHSDLLFRIAYAWGLSFALVALLALACGAYALLVRRRLEPEVRSWYGVLTRPPVSPAHLRGVPDEWYRRIAFACGIARVKNTVPYVFVTTAVASVVMTVVTGVELFYGEISAWHGALGWPSSANTAPGSRSGFVIHVGTVGLISAAGLLLLLGRRSLRSKQTRRGVNVIWDVVSFWPHSAHPFVPPAYSQFAVRELLTRIRYHLGSLDVQPPRGPADHVVVAGHSQGSLIAFAALLWLDADELARVGLVTHGSQLQVAFPRAFPAYVNDGLIEQLFRRLEGRWINLYRETDPIAGPVLSWRTTRRDALRSTFVLPDGEVAGGRVVLPSGRRECGHDWRLLDPAPADAALQQGAVVKMCRHSDFPNSEDWRDAVEAVTPSRRPASLSRAAAPASPQGSLPRPRSGRAARGGSPGPRTQAGRTRKQPSAAGS